MIPPKIKIDDKEFETGGLGSEGKKTFAALKFVTEQMTEKKNSLALLTKARKGYIDEIKKEIISAKGGFLFEDD